MVKYIFKRVLILIVPMVLVFLITFLTYDEHARCTGDKHRHDMGYMGFFIFSIFWLSSCGPILLIQTVLEFFKRRKYRI